MTVRLSRMTVRLESLTVRLESLTYYLAVITVRLESLTYYLAVITVRLESLTYYLAVITVRLESLTYYLAVIITARSPPRRRPASLGFPRFNLTKTLAGRHHAQREPSEQGDMPWFRRRSKPVSHGLNNK
jgi:hypothetical protein